MPSPRKAALVAGDVLKTHPKDGFWGCAVVLKSGGHISGLRPMCLVGVTSLVVQHDYRWEDIAQAGLEVLRFDRGVRTAPNTYRTRTETCIKIHTTKQHPQVPVIGQVDPSLVYSGPLDFEAGDGTDGQWPLCGDIAPSLGAEAVARWRSVNDAAQWQSDLQASRAATEALFARMRDEEAAARAKRRRARGA